MTDTVVRVEMAEGLVVGPDEVLIIRFADVGYVDDDILAQVLDHLEDVGLKDRTFIVVGDIELAKAKKTA